MKNKVILALGLLLLFGLGDRVWASASGDVGNQAIKDGAVKNAEIASDAAIAYSKLNLATSLTLADAAASLRTYQDTAIANAALDTLNATPVTLVTAAGSGVAIIVDSVFCKNTFLTAALELGSGTFDVRYENSSGALIAQFPNAFVESAATAYMNAGHQLSAVVLLNKAVVIHASADVTSGGGAFACRTFYHTYTP